MVCCIKSTIYAGILQEQGAKNDLWTSDERGSRRMGKFHIDEFRDFISYKNYYLGDKINDHEMGRSHGTHWENKRIFTFSVLKP